MDAELSRSSIAKKKDPHDWNSYDHYRSIHEKRLAEHQFIDDAQPNTLVFDFLNFEGGLWLRQMGRLFCKKNVILEVGKLFETRHAGNILQVRGVLYRYVAWVTNGHPVLKYHNLHDDHDQYIHRAFDCGDGKQCCHEILERHQFPTFTEVIDEIELLTANLN